MPILDTGTEGQDMAKAFTLIPLRRLTAAVVALAVAASLALAGCGSETTTSSQSGTLNGSEVEFSLANLDKGARFFHLPDRSWQGRPAGGQGLDGRHARGTRHLSGLQRLTQGVLPRKGRGIAVSELR